ncbi:CDP-alcohol phosphatidyltransferase family protein [candidate division WOR-3 bacterium]|nr:CDP-alcohol phosphatidyltransferase family protein [candidate division WOR-3 bacterium]
MIPESLKTKVRELLLPLAKLFSKVHPNLLTFIGFLITGVASFFYARGIFWLGGIILLVGGLFDTLDGEVAKLTGRESKFGAFLDSCIDRYSDFVILFGMFLWYMPLRVPTILVLLAMFGSYIISYTRARAESLGCECKVGLGERAFRIVLLVVGSFFGPKIFIGFLLLFVIITNGTGIYRMLWVWRKLKMKS